MGGTWHYALVKTHRTFYAHMAAFPIKKAEYQRTDFLNCGFWNVVLEKTLKSPLDCKEIKPVNPKGNQPWIFIGRTDADLESTILQPPDAKTWMLGKIEGKRSSRGLDGGMASPIQWTWIWANSRRYWRTEEPGMLQSMGSQRVRHNLATEQQQFSPLHTPSSSYKTIPLFQLDLN